MRLFTFLLPAFLFSCMNSTGVIDKKKDTAVINNSKAPVELLPDSNAVKVAYAKSLIDTSHSLIMRSIVEKIPGRQSDQQIAPIMKEYFRAFKALKPIDKAEVTKYRIQKIRELAAFRSKDGF